MKQKQENNRQNMENKKLKEVLQELEKKQLLPEITYHTVAAPDSKTAKTTKRLNDEIRRLKAANTRLKQENTQLKQLCTDLTLLIDTLRAVKQELNIEN